MSIHASAFCIKKGRGTHCIENPNMIHFFNTPIRNIDCLVDYFIHQLITNESLCDAEDGIFTWVMVKPNKVYALRTYSNQEIGTLHRNLIEYVRVVEGRRPGLMVAGEMEIHTDVETGIRHLAFNFQSSLFVFEVLEKEMARTGISGDEIQQRLSTVMEKRFQSLCPNTVIHPSVGKDIIEHTQFLNQPERIQLYERCLTRRPSRPNHRKVKYNRVYVTKRNNKKRPNEVNQIANQIASLSLSNQVAASAALSTNASHSRNRRKNAGKYVS